MNAGHVGLASVLGRAKIRLSQHAKFTSLEPIPAGSGRGRPPATAMKPAVVRFLLERPDCRVVDVARLDVAWAAPNACLGNAALLQAMDPEVWRLQAGWMVGDDFGELGTVFVPHYWVLDAGTGQGQDPTPRAVGDAQNYDYLVDPDLLRYATPEHPLPAPFWLDARGDFVALAHGGHYEKLPTLSTAFLFTLPSHAVVREAMGGGETTA